jgi:hypothetical protein
MKLIPLSKNGRKHKGKYFAQVDDADYEWLNQWDWCVWVKPDGTPYAIRTDRSGERQKTIQMHRFILGLTDPNIDCDHIDHIGTNNQRWNLRVATERQNCFNSRSRKNSSSKFKGVHWHSWKDFKPSWTASIKIENKQKHLGSFQSEEEAARAYDDVAKKHFGEFAKLNFPTF